MFGIAQRLLSEEALTSPMTICCALEGHHPEDNWNQNQNKGDNDKVAVELRERLGAKRVKNHCSVAI